MFVIFGMSRKRHPVGAYQGQCTACYRQSVNLGLVEKRAFSVFFIPLVPLGSSKRMLCTACGSEQKVKAVPPSPEYVEIHPSQVRSRIADLSAQQPTQFESQMH